MTAASDNTIGAVWSPIAPTFVWLVKFHCAQIDLDRVAILAMIVAALIIRRRSSGCAKLGLTTASDTGY